jgi:hypothetical protein
VNEFFQTIGVWATEGVLGLVVIGLIRLWFAFLTYKTEAAIKYATQDQLGVLFAEQKTDLHAVKETVERILGMVHEIKGSLHGITRE